MYQSALNLAKSFDISDSMPRRGGRQTTRAKSPCGNAKTVLANFFVLSIFGQFDYELETRLLKSENRFHAQHLLPRALDKLTDDHIATIYEAYQTDIYLSLEDFRREVARWRTHWVITKRNDFPTTLCTTLDSVNPVLYPSVDAILIKLSGLVHIHRDFEVDLNLYKAMEVFVYAKTRRADFGQFKEILVYQSLKLCLILFYMKP